jgi:DNA-binding response OmpR family regulator
MKILVLDDDDMFLEILAEDMEAEGHEVGMAESLEEARGLLEKESWDALSFDLRLGDGISIDLIKEAFSMDNPPKAALVVTSHHDDPAVSNCSDLGPCSYVVKPIGAQTILVRLGQLMNT